VSITSTLNDATNVVIIPEWRDSGHVELVQSFPPPHADACELIPEIEMAVTREEDTKTPLGRYEPHLSIRLSPTPAPKPAPSDDTPPPSPDTAHHYLPSKAIERVMLDDGTIHPDSQEYTSLPRGMKRVEYHDGTAHITQADKADASSQSNEAAAGEGRDSLSSLDAAANVLTIRIPEKINVNCDLRGATDGVSGGGSIAVRGKLEGNVRLLTCGGGDVSVTKLRGHVIELESIGNGVSGETTSPSILVRDLIEAQSLTVACTGRFRAKQIHGRSISIDVNHRGSPNGNDSSSLDTPIGADSDDELSLVDVGALFVSGGRGIDDASAGGGGGASIRVRGDPSPSTVRRRAVRVKSHHGALEVFAESLCRPSDVDPYTHQTYPLVELGGVNGSFEVTIQDATAAPPASFPRQEWTSCKVHVDSLHPESVSLVTSDQGDLALTLDRKAETDLRLLSTSSSSTLREAGAALAEEDDSDLLLRVLQHLPRDPPSNDNKQAPRISVLTAAFTCSGRRYESDDGSIAYREGFVENKSHEPDSRFDRRTQGKGKIRLDGAAAQALQGFVSRPNEVGGQATSAHEGATAATSTAERPLVAVASTGNISVETVSWIGAIARRYGLDDDSHRGLGRTASRRGRPIAAATDNE
jgi:hypothetical protein